MTIRSAGFKLHTVPTNSSYKPQHTHMTNESRTLGIRMDEELHDELVLVAEECNTTMTHLVTSTLRDALMAVKAEAPTTIRPQGIALARIKYHWPRVEGIDVSITIHSHTPDV